MHQRELGQGLVVSALGLGCMTMTPTKTGGYGVPDPASSRATIDRAIDLGVTFFDTAEVYGPHLNETFLGEAIKGRREGLVIATKFGFRIEGAFGLDSAPANVARACDGSLRRLGIDHIDLYYQHRVDPDVPIEDTVGAMAELVRAGKVRHIGLSEPAADTIRRAHAVHPIAAVQSEYSLWERGVEDDIRPVLDELGIGLVPYSPLGRGFLAGSIRSRDELGEGDYRLSDPRWAEGNFERNMAIVEAVAAIGRRHGASPAQVALAWLLAQGPGIAPIPGAKRLVTLEDSMAAADLALTPDDLAAIDAAVPAGTVAGERYASKAMLAMTRR